MATITNPQAVLFCNTHVRVMYDKMMQMYNYAKNIESAWTAQGLAAIIPNDPAQPVVDGSAQDGRPPLTGANVNVLIANAQTLINTFEANTNLILNQTLIGSVQPNSGF